MPVALVRRVQGQAERAERVLLADEEERHRHRDVLVDPRHRHRLLEDLGPLWLRRLERRLAVGDPVRVAGEDLAQLLLAQPGRARGAQRDQQRRRLLSVRVVGRVDDLLRRH